MKSFIFRPDLFDYDEYEYFHERVFKQADLREWFKSLIIYRWMDYTDLSEE